MRFTHESGAENPINSAWHFFETMYQSGIYWKFIGLSQLLAGLLLMTQRYAKLGALINFPIILNIFVITISYEFRGTPIITGMMLLANLMLLIWDRNTFGVLLNQAPILETKHRLEHDNLWAILGLILFSFTFIYRMAFVKYDLVIWLGVCVLISTAGLIVALRKDYKLKKS